MLANELINRLERLGLLDQEIIEALREQLDQGTRVTPEAVAKLLVDNGQLTHFQATKLIGELRSGQYEDELDDQNSGSSLNDDLTAGFEDELSTVPEQPQPAAKPVTPEPVVAEPVPAYEAEPVAAEPVALDAFSAEPLAAQVPPDRPRPTRKKPDPQKSVWDSFKIYGFLSIIVVLLLAGFFFYFVLGKENEDDYIAEANKFYDQQNYDDAQEFYTNYLEMFGQDSQYSSMARTRVTMTELYKSASFKNKPWEAVDLAKEKLPVIAEEPGMNEDRGNLAALLVDIAANVAVQADKAKQTDEKQSLLAKLDEQRQLMNDPLYMPTSIKTTLEGQIQAVEESRARVQRDIDRNIRLDESEASMKESLELQNTKRAYDTRKELLRGFPELHDHERLQTLILAASEIQQTLVKPSTKLPKTVIEPPAGEDLTSISLTTLAGGTALELRGVTLYFRARGSILAFDGETGRLRWRKYVGESDELPPLRLDSGVLLSESATHEVFRCSEEDGSVLWRAQIGERFGQPIAVGNEIYVSTDSGRLIALDVDSGDAKWATEIPQQLECGAGIDDRANRAYVAGNHSNLYVLNTRDGSCIESFYIGHNEGTITVPPVSLLGHLFVIENAGADYAKVHVLNVDETGANLGVAQSLIRLIGNVRIPPIIQGRRLIVLTDRGQVTVLDIEPTSEREKVTVAASLPPFYDQPTSTQMAVSRSQMWITGNEIARYELQINTGKVKRGVGKHALDTFIGKPFAADGALVYARVLRGTTAIRVTAADPKTMEEIWRTDVGVPVSMITRAPGGQGFHAVTSQAALFQLDRESLATGSTTGPIENPGRKALAIRFEDPIAIDQVRSLMLNQVDGKSLILYEPQRESQKLRQVTMRLSAGRPATSGVIAGREMFMPLDTGRAVMINWRTGAVSPGGFQPASDPGGFVRWTQPLPLPDDAEQVVLADSRKKIYRLRIGDQIRELASRDMDYELIGPTAGIAGTMLGTTSEPSADSLVGFEMATLTEKFKTSLDGRVMWGPVAAGDVGLILTDDHFLRGFDSDGAQQFQLELPAGQPIGKPITHNDSILLAGKSGWIVAIDAASGNLIGTSDIGQPLSATPLMIGTSLLVPGTEGVIYIADIPQ